MRVVAIVAFGLCLASLGCTPTVHAGLANAPGLGGTRIADTRLHDVIANGQDSCGRPLEPNSGPLRYRLPPCRREGVPATSAALVPSGEGDDSVELHWMEHYYFGWPCKARQEALANGVALAWSPAFSAAGVCLSR
jgi:hypothetical protein